MWGDRDGERKEVKTEGKREKVSILLSRLLRSLT